MPSLSQTTIKNEPCRYSLPLELLFAEGLLLAGSHTMHFALKIFPLLLHQCFMEVCNSFLSSCKRSTVIFGCDHYEFALKRLDDILGEFFHSLKKEMAQ